jgi:hypothetical protein
LGSFCIYSLPTDKEALLDKIRDEVLAQEDLINCTASYVKLEADAKKNFSTSDAQVVRVFRNLEEVEGFDQDDAFALGDDDSHLEDRDKRQCTLVCKTRPTKIIFVAFCC